MRTLKYQRHEFHQDAPDIRQASLAEFVLDVPYLLARGVVPPHHILNAVLQTGGGDAGMSPGTGWEPFQVTTQEYEELLEHLRGMDLDQVQDQDRARFVPDRILLDETLWDCTTHHEWLRQVHQKYP